MRTYARNDITGKVIKTDVPNKAYDIGWDRAFSKKTSHYWLETMPDITLEDAIGWNEETTLDTPIKYKEFLERLENSKYKRNE